jgi:hypothetical protein
VLEFLRKNLAENGTEIEGQVRTSLQEAKEEYVKQADVANSAARRAFDRGQNALVTHALLKVERIGETKLYSLPK